MQPDGLSQPLECCPEEGAEQREQLILKPENFQILPIDEDDEAGGYISQPEPTMKNRITVKRLSAKAILLTKVSRFAAGPDIYAISEFTIPPQGQGPAETGRAIGLPKETYAQIAPRSGLESKRVIASHEGVIKADYTGKLKVIMSNHARLTA